MEVWLTRGMFGEKSEKLAGDAKTGAEALAAIHEWKNREAGKGAYKVERYDRFLFGEEGVAVDFGDYSSFFLITGPGAKAEISKALSPKGTEGA